MQGGGFKMLVTMEDDHTMSNTMTYSAVIVEDVARAAFIGPNKSSGTDGTYASGDVWASGTINSVHFDLSADRSAGTVTLTLPESATKHFGDVFEGIWDLVEYDPSKGSGDKYTRQMEGDVVISAGAVLQGTDTFTATIA